MEKLLPETNYICKPGTGLKQNYKPISGLSN